jgi:hypothetical protein
MTQIINYFWKSGFVGIKPLRSLLSLRLNFSVVKRYVSLPLLKVVRRESLYPSQEVFPEY